MCYENPRSTKIGKRIGLQLGLNTLIDSFCSGCRFNDYPYTTTSVLRSENGKFGQITFYNDSDLWGYMHKLKLEAISIEGRSLSDVIIDIYEQLPFFCCKNKVINEDCTNDIRRYTYCEESGQKAYDGSYGDVPSLWVEKHFLIRNIITNYKNRVQQREHKKMQKKK